MGTVTPMQSYRGYNQAQLNLVELPSFVPKAKPWQQVEADAYRDDFRSTINRYNAYAIGAGGTLLAIALLSAVQQLLR